MKKYRYIPEVELPKVAQETEVQAILIALKQRRYKIIGRARSYVEGPWKTTNAAFVAAVVDHLEFRHRIFHKALHCPPPDTRFFSANVRLDRDSDDEDDDVYVEIRLENQTLVIICDAHSHDRWKPRLPK